MPLSSSCGADVVGGVSEGIGVVTETSPEEPSDDVWGDLVALILAPVTLLIDGVKDVIDVGLAGVTRVIDAVDDRVREIPSYVASEAVDLKESLIHKIDEIKISINALDIPTIDDINNKFVSLIDKIDGLEFPTVASIKEGFLSLTTEFAESIWDKILDKIEERYNK